jgi:tetratricopeptide (TPR) repeat protein
MKDFLVVYLVLSFAFAVFAGQKEFIRDYTYQASETDSKVTARTNASVEMRNILLREIGEFIKASQTVADGDYSEKVEGVTAGIVEMTILSENWTGTAYYIKAKMVVDDGDVKKRIDAIMKDNQRAQEFHDARKRMLDAETEAYRLRNQKGVTKEQYQQKMAQLAQQDYFTSGLAAYENGNYSLAVTNFQKAGGIADVYYMLGKVYAETGDTKKSDENFKKAADMGHPAAQYRIRKQGYKR